MTTLLAFIVGCWFGVFVGFGVAALCTVASSSEAALRLREAQPWPGPGRAVRTDGMDVECVDGIDVRVHS